MKATCDRPKLLAAFQTAALVIPSRSPKPILQNAKIAVQKEGTELLATDLEVGIRCKVSGVEVEQAGEVVLPGASINSILRELTDERVSLESDANSVVVRGGRSEFKLPTAPASEFPGVPEFDAEKFHVVPAPLLREMIRRTVFATDVESTRYALGGVLLEIDKKGIALIATDGRRLALMLAEAHAHEGHTTEGATPVVPTKAMNLIERSLHGENTEVSLAVVDNKVLVRSEGSVISSVLLEGRFPRYQDVFPKSPHAKIEVVAGPLLSVVRQGAIVTSEESRGVDFRFADGQLTLESRATDVGQSQVELPIAYDGEKVEITFDPHYVIDFLRVLDPETTVTIELIDHESAAVFRTGDGYSYVVMPLTRER